jgi:DhnA family fructose-bisphosphate aldolase class Ia
MNNKSYRLREIINPSDSHSLIVETSEGLSMGPLPGLERYSESVFPTLPFVDGVVSSPGQARKLSGRTCQDAALLVRADWTNALRGADFVLPPESNNLIPLLSPQDVLNLGASAMVLYFLLGYEEEIEAGCLQRTVQTSLEGAKVGLPLIVDVQPIGPRVVLFKKAVELGVSYALEGGADGVAIPWPGKESFKTIITMAGDVPVWIKPSSLEDAEVELSQALELGGTGVWLGNDVFAQSDSGKIIQEFSSNLRKPLVVEDK